jgi:hypothetical protein
MSICKGCGLDEPLIRAHAIPEAFFRPLQGKDGKAAFIVTNRQGEFTKRSPIGPYDKAILCRECEDRFAKLDDYGQKVLLQTVNNLDSIVDQHGTLIGYWLRTVDTALFKRFLISVLWRASVSTQPFYGRVSLGPYEEIIRELLWNEAPLKQDEYSFLLGKFTDEFYGRTMLDPFPEKWDGINYYRLYLCGYTAHIKIDKRPSSKAFKPFNQGGVGDLVVLARDIRKSGELDIMVDVVRGSK